MILLRYLHLLKKSSLSWSEKEQLTIELKDVFNNTDSNLGKTVIWPVGIKIDNSELSKLSIKDYDNENYKILNIDNFIYNLNLLFQYNLLTIKDYNSLEILDLEKSFLDNFKFIDIEKYYYKDFVNLNYLYKLVLFDLEKLNTLSNDNKDVINLSEFNNYFYKLNIKLNDYNNMILKK